MIRGWIRLWRKALDNDIIKDVSAWHIFTWLLLKVDKTTGDKTIGRFWASEELGMKPGTFYDALKRLEKKYKVVTLTPTSKNTKISFINWHKYQGGNNKPTTNQQQTNTLQEYKNKELKNNNILDAKRPLSTNNMKKEPSKKQLPYFNILDHLEKVLNTKITIRGKQCSAIKSMLNAGYTELQIIKTIDYMANKDEFYSDKGFDMTTVAKQISLYKAQMRKAVTT